MTTKVIHRTLALAMAGLLVWLFAGPSVFSQEQPPENQATAQFLLERYDVYEGASVVVELLLSASPGDSVTIPVVVTPGDGVGAGPDDYAITPEGGFAFGPGDTSAAITVTAHSDSVEEPAESLVISLDLEGVAGIGGDAPATTVTINDVPPTPPPAIELSLDPALVDEDAGAATVNVTASLPGAGPSPEADIQLTLSVTADTASAGDDYAAVDDFPLTIPAGETSGAASFTLEVVDDDLAEGPETLTVSGIAQGFGVLSATLFIFDNDGAVVTVEDVTVQEEDAKPR